MRILKLCLSQPHRVGNGISKLVVNRTIELERRGHRVDVVYFKVLAGTKKDIRLRRRQSGGEDICLEIGLVRIIWVFVKRVWKLTGKIPVQCMLSAVYREVFGDYISFTSEQYDICHFYHLRTLGLWRCVGNSGPAVAIDLIDSYTLNYRNRLIAGENILLRWLIKLELLLIERIERNIDGWLSGSQRKVVLTVASRDSQLIDSGDITKAVVPVGIDMETGGRVLGLKAVDNRLRVVFFGNLDYEPNITACKILAKVASLNKNTCVSFAVGGRNASRSLREMLRKEQIEVVSPVVDMESFVKGADIALLPMVSGSGMQSKILEAIVWNCIVIATKRVAEPLGLEEGKEYIRAEEAMEFSKAIDSVHRGEYEIEKIKKAAVRRVEAFKWSDTVDLLLGVYRSIGGEVNY